MSHPRQSDLHMNCQQNLQSLTIIQPHKQKQRDCSDGHWINTAWLCLQSPWDFIFCWPCISVWFLLINNLTHFFQCIYLLPFTKCFEQSSAHHQENQITSIHHLVYITLCGWLPGSFLTGVPGSQLHGVTYTRWCTDTIRFSWWWALGCSKHVEKWPKHIKECIKCVFWFSLQLLPETNPC